jgi:hypothetical protein
MRKLSPLMLMVMMSFIAVDGILSFMPKTPMRLPMPHLVNDQIAVQARTVHVPALIVADSIAASLFVFVQILRRPVRAVKRAVVMAAGRVLCSQQQLRPTHARLSYGGTTRLDPSKIPHK